MISTTALLKNPGLAKLSPMVNLTEVAEHFDVSRRTILRMIERGEIPQPCRVGRQLRWSVDAINQWVADNCPASASEGT